VLPKRKWMPRCEACVRLRTVNFDMYRRRDTAHVHPNRGFTLIELLVVIAIIGLLSSIILASLNGARAKARNARRQADLKELQTALELYYNDHNAYPSTGGQWYSSETGDATGDNGGDYIPGLVPNYIGTLPRSPGGPSPSICGPWKNSYLYRSDGTNYKLLAHCAPEGSWNSSNTFYDPVRPTWAWMVCSDNPACTTW
jgi:type II secretion system protein G